MDIAVYPDYLYISSVPAVYWVVVDGMLWDILPLLTQSSYNILETGYNQLWSLYSLSISRYQHNSSLQTKRAIA